MGCYKSKLYTPEQNQETTVHSGTYAPPYVAYSGGASNGIVYVGAYRALYEQNIIQRLHGAVGTSIGSVFAVVSVLQIDPHILYRAIMELDTNKLADYSANPVVDAVRLVQSYGICKGDFLQVWVEQLIFSQTNIHCVTFAELFEITGRHLKITCFNETLVQTEYWDHLTQPGTPVSLAVRTSASMPGFYIPVHKDGYTYIDGGVGDIFPVDVFPGALGLMVVGAQNTKNTEFVKPIAVTNLLEHCMAVYTGLTTVQFRLQHQLTGWAERSIDLRGPDKPQWDFSFTTEQKIQFISLAYEQTRSNLEIRATTGVFPVDK